MYLLFIKLIYELLFRQTKNDSSTNKQDQLKNVEKKQTNKDNIYSTDTEYQSICIITADTVHAGEITRAGYAKPHGVHSI